MDGEVLQAAIFGISVYGFFPGRPAPDMQQTLPAGTDPQGAVPVRIQAKDRVRAITPLQETLRLQVKDPSAANNAQFMALGGMYSMIPFIAMCASIAMLFPISTPPNAIASSTGLVQTSQMAKIGIIVGVVGFVLGYFLLTVVFPFPTA